MNIDTAIITQAIFDILIVAYILIIRYFDKKENESFVKLTNSLKNLLERQKNLIDSANEKIVGQERNLNIILDDVKRKNNLLTELLTTIKNKTYKDSLKNSIILMKKDGMNIEDIAKNVHLSSGEVELILKLYEEEKSEKS